MEDYKDITNILDLMPQPVFCVRDGSILCRNQAAGQLHLEPGLPVAELLGDAVEDYRRFEDGSLYLALLLPGQTLEAHVTRLNQVDYFVVERLHPELQAMSLAALQFREPLSDTMSLLKQIPTTADCPYIGHLNRRLFQMQRLVFNMTDAARYTNETSSRQMSMNISSLINEIFQHVRDLAQKNGIQFVYSCPKEPIMTLLSAERLERAVYNMISNAMKATAKGGTIEAKLSCVKNRLYLTVRDYGAGIPEHIRSSVYTRYLRQPDLINGQEGLGLGMTLIRSAATSHGGTLLIDHPDGVGTRVTMSLSLRKTPDTVLRSSLPYDYAGNQDHGLLELSDLLPPDLYSTHD